MKKFYLLILVSFISFCNAQNITFTDPAFKNFLVTSTSTNFRANDLAGNMTAVDANGDGEIQISEALNISSLTINYTQISNLSGIQSFANLETLTIQQNSNINQLNVSNLVNLKRLTIHNQAISSINTNGCTQLDYFSLSDNGGFVTSLAFLQGNTNLKKLRLIHNEKLGSVIVSNFINLEEIEVSSYNYINNNLSFTSLDLSANLNLKKINIDVFNLTTLILNPLVNLEHFIIKNTPLTTINLGNAAMLNYLFVDNNSLLTSINIQNAIALNNIQLHNNPLITNINVQNRPNLTSFSMSNNGVTSINFTGSPNIVNLSIGGNALTTLDLSPITNLPAAHISENIASLDVSQNSALTFVTVSGTGLQYLNLKNGNQNLAFYPSNSTYLPNLAYVCADSNKIQEFSNKLILGGHTNVQVNSYCSFTPGGTFYTLQGITKYDMNNNGCDSADPNYKLQKFNISGANDTGSVIGNTTGQYSISLQAGSNILTPVLENPSYFNISPTSFTANFPAMTSPLNQNFCLTANGNHNDLEIVIIPLNAARPGFVSEYKVLFKNKGTATQAGSLSFNYDDNLMNFLSTSLATSSQSFGVLNYNFTNLLPFQTRELTVKFTLNTPTATPPLLGGHILSYNAQINGATDETPSDNTFTLSQTTVNSFDPNDKTCLEGATITQTKVGDYVHYLIRFENTGTANAENIVVKDMIDTSKFDINSLVAMSGSHSFVTRITNANTVEFIFEGIQLPFNDLYNDGYVSFKIKTKSTLALGDSFSNTANIYFDYNAPIVTNTATTTVANVLGTQENVIENSFSFYPNPVEDMIHFKSDEKLLKVEIYDVSGRIVGSVKVQNNEADLSFLKTGNYLLKTFTKGKEMTTKIVKK